MNFVLNLFIIIVDQLMLFAVNVFVARHAGEILFGNFMVAINGLLFMAAFLTLGLDSIISYYIPKLYYKKKYNEIAGLLKSITVFIKPYYVTVFITGLLFSVAILISAGIFKALHAFETFHPLMLFLWGTVAISIYNILIQLFRTINYMRTSVILSFFQTVLYFTFSFICYQYYPVLFGNDVSYFPHFMVLGYIASYLLIILISTGILCRTHFIRKTYNATVLHLKWKSKIYGYTIQNLNSYIFSTIPLIAMQCFYHHAHSVGLFGAIVSIISLAHVSIYPLGVLMGSEISIALAQNREALKKVMFKFLKISLVIAVITTSFFALCARQILLMYKSNFIDALPYLYICLIAIVTYAVSMPLYKMIQYSKYGNVLGSRLILFFLILQTISSTVLVILFGLNGAVITYVGMNIFYLTTILIVAWRIYHELAQ